MLSSKDFFCKKEINIEPIKENIRKYSISSILPKLGKVGLVMNCSVMPSLLTLLSTISLKGQTFISDPNKNPASIDKT